MKNKCLKLPDQGAGMYNRIQDIFKDHANGIAIRGVLRHLHKLLKHC
jgi:hypothetical protein